MGNSSRAMFDCGRFTCNEMLIPELLDWCDGYKVWKTWESESMADLGQFPKGFYPWRYWGIEPFFFGWSSSPDIPFFFMCIVYVYHIYWWVPGFLDHRKANISDGYQTYPLMLTFSKLEGSAFFRKIPGSSIFHDQKVDGKMVKNDLFCWLFAGDHGGFFLQPWIGGTKSWASNHYGNWCRKTLGFGVPCPKS